MAVAPFRHKAVRDLHWALASPSILAPGDSIAILPDASSAEIVDRSLPWLLELERCPEHLEEWLAQQRNVRRLGIYFAALLQYWVRFCPHLAEARASGEALVLSEQQVHLGLQGEVAGQLKCVFQRRAHSVGPQLTSGVDAPTVELEHWESHIKYFAYVPPAEPMLHAAAEAPPSYVPPAEPMLHAAAEAPPSYVPPAEPMLHAAAEAPPSAAAEGARPSHLDSPHPQPEDWALAEYVGPFLGARHSMPSPCDSFARAALPYVHPPLRLAGENLLQRVIEMRRKLSLSAAPAVRSFLAARFGLSSPAHVSSRALLRGYLFYPLDGRREEPCPRLNGAHLAGWWARRIDDAFSRFAGALWALPGNGAGVRGASSLGAVGGKLHWLAPAVATRVDGALQISGIRRLGVEACPLLTEDELRAALERRAAASAGVAPQEQAVLVLQLRPLPGEAEVWVEQSRGFVMPPQWDPRRVYRTLAHAPRPPSAAGALVYAVRGAASAASAASACGWRPDGSFVGHADAPRPPLASRREAVGAAAAAARAAFPRLAAQLQREVAAVCDAFLEACEHSDGSAEAREAVARLEGAVHQMFGQAPHARSLTRCAPTTSHTTAQSSAHPHTPRLCIPLASMTTPLAQRQRHKKDGKEKKSLKAKEAKRGERESIVDCATPANGASRDDRGRVPSGSMFAVCREALSECIHATASGGFGGRCAPVRLLRQIGGVAREKFIGSLLLASMSYSGLLRAEDGCRGCTALLEECLSEKVPLHPSLVLDLLGLLSAQRAPHCAAASRLSAGSCAASYVQCLATRGEWRVAVGVALELHEAVACEDLLTQLAAAGEWKHGQTLALGIDAIREGERGPRRQLMMRQLVELAHAHSHPALALKLQAHLHEHAHAGRQLQRATVARLVAEGTQAPRKFPLTPTPRRTNATSHQRHLTNTSAHRPDGAGSYQLAETFVGTDVQQQQLFLSLLQVSKQNELASSVAARFGLPLPRERERATPERVAEEESAVVGSAGGYEKISPLPPYTLPAGSRVHVFEVKSAAEEALCAMLRSIRQGDSAPVVGVDAEWVADRPVSLLQLAVHGVCVLLRMHTLVARGEGMPPSLSALLSDRSIVKTGVGATADLRYVRNLVGIPAAGVVELQHLAAKEGISPSGLQRLARDVLGRHLEKNPAIQSGNWEADTLSDEQVAYAAMDAHVSVDIFFALHELHQISQGDQAKDELDFAYPLTDMESKRVTKKQSKASVSPARGGGSGIATAARHESEPIADCGEAPEAADALDSDALTGKLAGLGLADVSHLIRNDEVYVPEDATEVKALALFLEGAPMVAVLPADCKLDRFKLARHMKLVLSSRKAVSKQVRLASPGDCVTTFGFAPGTVPPVGHRNPHPVVVDSSCCSSQHLVGGGGSAGTLLRLQLAPMLRLPFVQVGDIREVPREAPLDDASRLAAEAVERGELTSSHHDDGSGVQRSACEAFAGEVKPTGVGAACEPRFLVDAMLGKLLRWLRVIGVDTLRRDDGEDASTLFKRARSEERILLTRDRKLQARRDCACAIFVVGSDEPREQLQEVVTHFRLRLSPEEFMMRCAVCNGRGYHSISKEEAANRGDCPPKVLAMQDNFYACKKCDKLYWEGPKSCSAFGHFSSLFDDISEPSLPTQP
ncbi:hypothetical protein AB1Y20_020879 [Prymnesium parvum]|uniref:3'-5' exonuclease domain-containing protein n=1 Tax=Prymnesium parvum TaxID=97485 RepID=A0AB34JYQ4_PRYPA